MINIHKIDEKDAPKFLDLVVSVDSEAEFLLFDKSERKISLENTISYINKLNNNSSSILVVASDELGNFIGYAAGEQGGPLRLRHILNLNIAIKRINSNKGVGAALIDTILRHAQSHSIHKLEASIISENQPCLALAQKFDFQIEGRKKDAIIIGKTLYDLIFVGRVLNESPIKI